MNRSFFLGTVLGCRVRLHWSWPALPIGVAIFCLALRPWKEAAFFTLLVYTVYGLMGIHELARLLVARHLGLGPQELALYPFWGIARFTRQGERPRQEKFIAAAGWLTLAFTSLALGAGLLLAHRSIALPVGKATTEEQFPLYVLWACVALVGLHLLPFLPLDGGQVLRGMLAMRISRLHATEAAAAISTLGAGLILAIALAQLKSPLLGVTAALLYLGAHQELGSTRFFESMRRREADPAIRPATYVPVDQVSTADCQPHEANFTGFVWHPGARLWIEWQDGKPISANILIGDGGP